MDDSTDELHSDTQGRQPEERPRSLSEQITHLKRRRQELQELSELCQLQREVDSFEHQLADHEPQQRGLTPEFETTLSNLDPDERPARRRRYDDEPIAIAGRGPKIEKIPVFEGKGIREYYDFEARLQIAFRLDPAAFMLEDQKIAFTLQYLQPTFRQLWIQREQEDDGETLAWRDMMSFLLDQIKSPIN